MMDGYREIGRYVVAIQKRDERHSFSLALFLLLFLYSFINLLVPG